MAESALLGSCFDDTKVGLGISIGGKGGIREKLRERGDSLAS